MGTPLQFPSSPVSVCLVIGVPEIINPANDPLYDATARSAVAAVLECQAYSFLPQDKYDLWKDLIINFNPNMMFDS